MVMRAYCGCAAYPHIDQVLSALSGSLQVCAAPLPFGTECVGTDLPACVSSFPPATAEDGNLLAWLCVHRCVHRFVCTIHEVAFVMVVDDASAVAALLAQRQAISNWDKVVSGLELDGWNESVQVCSWTGVGCTDNGSIISV